jgi:FSR family fosmidomycin resistance protein-like MFS transporter
MSSRKLSVSERPARARRSLFGFVLVLLLIEFLDELLFGVREAAWPLIRDDLGLSYTQVGVILSVPVVVGNLVEPSFGIMADVWRRRSLVLGGGVAFALATLLVGLSPSFTVLLAATILFNPASGAFVGLSQATLMDYAPERREQNMVRWTLFGSLGDALGPVALGACVGVGLGWHWPFVGLSAFAVLMLLAAWRLPFPTPSPAEDARKSSSLAGGVREALRALRRREVLRWLVLLELGDLSSDVLRGFLALYFVDVVGTTEAGAAFAVIVWAWAVLPGELLLLPLLERVRGLSYLRVSTGALLVLFPAFLLVGGLQAKLVLLALLGLSNAGWYAILKAQLYAELPGRSGTAMTLGNVFGLAGAFIPLALGAFAQRFGLGAMMWVLVAGPLALFVGLLTVPNGGRKGQAEVRVVVE